MTGQGVGREGGVEGEEEEARVEVGDEEPEAVEVPVEEEEDVVGEQEGVDKGVGATAIVEEASRSLRCWLLLLLLLPLLLLPR